MMADGITAKGIVELLARKHHDDIFVAECKTGSSYMARRGKGEMQQMDAWAMTKSWSTSTAYGYEVKVSYWRKWLLDKKERQDIGHRASRKLADAYNAIRCENNLLKDKLAADEEFRRALRKRGLDPDDGTLWDVQRAVDEKIKGVPRELMQAIGVVKRHIEWAERAMSCLEGKE